MVRSRGRVVDSLAESTADLWTGWLAAVEVALHPCSLLLVFVIGACGAWARPSPQIDLDSPRQEEALAHDHNAWSL